MPIYASAGENKTFEPAPAGTYAAVCVDVIDKGMKDTSFGPKHKIDLAWQIAETRTDGKPFLVFKRYTLSLHEKAVLRHDLESWRGRPFTAAEEARFDVEAVLGKSCLINIQHRTNGEKTYANVMAVMPLAKGMPALTPDGSYVRAINRPKDEQAVDESSFESAPEPPPPSKPTDISDDDIPF